MSTIRTTVDDHTYNAANDILGALGMDMNAAVRMFLQGVVLSGGTPLNCACDPTRSRQFSSARKPTGMRPGRRAKLLPGMAASLKAWIKCLPMSGRTGPRWMRPDGGQERSRPSRGCLYQGIPQRLSLDEGPWPAGRVPSAHRLRLSCRSA